MFVDTSAIVAVILDEPEATSIKKIVERTPNSITSPMVRLETSIVIGNKLKIGPVESENLFNKFLAFGEITIVPLTDETGSLAVAAYEKFGKGRHPAKLNLADCFSYGVAKSLGVPILFIGNDFSKTDLKSAL
jgi:ribonuclease VapC